MFGFFWNWVGVLNNAFGPIGTTKKSLCSPGKPLHDCLTTKRLFENRLSDVRITFPSKDTTEGNSKQIKAAAQVKKGPATRNPRTEERVLTKSEAMDRFNSSDNLIEEILASGHHEFFG